MANGEHLKILQKGVVAWSQWKETCLSDEVDLRSVSFPNSSLRGVNLSNTDLRGADLSGADLAWSNLNRADFRGANLSRVNCTLAALIEANLTGADLYKAELTLANLRSIVLVNGNLHGAKLDRANLINANLVGSDFTDVQIGNTAFDNVDLSHVKGLNTIYHFGPSSIGIDTIYRSKGSIPEAFLRGAGVPNIFIDYVNSLVRQPIDFYSCFIRYSTCDETFAVRVHADLQDRGVRCWLASKDMKIGDKIRPRIDEAIHLQDKLLLLLSEHAIASAWVEDEVEAALEKENQQQRDVLFPVRIDESVMQTSKAWAAKIRRTRHIGDFTNWTDSQAYQLSFDRLMRDLKRS